jgi:hypothetical protein
LRWFRLVPNLRSTVRLRNFFAELQRRNAYKVTAAYVVVAWLLIQAASIVFPTFEAPAWPGLLYACLGRKGAALLQGRRAVELLPAAKDAINGANIMQFLSVIYAWTGEKTLALEQVAATLQVPGRLSYGQLRLHPFRDPLRGDPRFENIVASLAPKP